MLSYFLLRFDTFDTERMNQVLQEFDPNGVVVVWDYAGEIRVLHSPPSIPLKPRYRFFRPGTWTENRWIKHSSWILTMTWVMWSVLRRERAELLHIGGGDIMLWIAQIFKKLGRVKRTITTLEDWSLPHASDNLYVRLNKWKILLNDILICRMDTTVIVTPKEIFDSRNRYWNGRTASNSILYDNRWAWFLDRKRKPSARGNYICSLGNLRSRMGIELLFELLPELNEQFGFRLKVIGPESDIYAHYKQLSKKMNVDQFIEWKGFVTRDALAAELDGCFCGLNLQEDETSNSRFVITGRIVEYLQNMIVPVVTPFSGAVVRFIEEHKMGVVCQADRESVKAAILKAHAHHSEYIGGIDHFLSTNPYRLEAKHILT